MRASSASRLTAALSFAIALAGCGSQGVFGGASGGVCLAPSEAKVRFAQPVELRAGTAVVAVVRDACSAPGAIVSLIANRYAGRTRSGVRAYRWILPRSYSRTEFDSLVASDSCLESISEAEQQTARADSGEDMDSVATQALPDDPQVARQRHLEAIGADDAFEIFYDPIDGIRENAVIAVIDSGVDLGHEDLRANIWTNKKEIAGNGIDDDRNGYVDDVNGWNFASRVPSPEPEKTSANAAWQWAHGTRVAGLAAAVAGNGKGVTGIAGHARIMALNNMGKTAAMDQTDTANAVRYAVDNGADVINLSLGGSVAGTDFKNALRYAVKKGVVVLAAAGNENSRIDGTYSAAGQGPSLAGLISIGNYQAATFERSTSSNYSTTYVELGAPGTYTMSTLLFTTSPSWSSSYGYYGYFSGTSAAVPVASGAAALAVALIKSRGYAYTAGDIERLLIDSAAKKPALASYFKDGNALDLAALAERVDALYPADGSPQATPPPIVPTPRPSTDDNHAQDGGEEAEGDSCP